MARYYLATIVGSGTPGDPYRSKVADYGVPHVAAIESNPDGSPINSSCLTCVNATDYSALDADPDIDYVCDG